MKHHAELWQSGRKLAERDGDSSEMVWRDLTQLSAAHAPDGPTEIIMDGRTWKDTTPQARSER